MAGVSTRVREGGRRREEEEEEEEEEAWPSGLQTWHSHK